MVGPRDKESNSQQNSEASSHQLYEQVIVEADPSVNPREAIKVPQPGNVDSENMVF